VFAGVVTAPIVTWLINSVAGGNWKFGYYYFGVFSIIGLILAFFIIDKPEKVGQYPDGVNPADAVNESAEEKKEIQVSTKVFKNLNEANHFSYQQALKTPLFWALVILHACALCLSNFIMNPGSLLFVKAGFTMATVSTVLSIRQIIRLLFLAFLMRYMDRIEPMKLFIFTCALAAVCYLVSANPTSYWQIIAFYAGGSIVMSAQMAIPGVMLANIYGTKNFGKIYGTYLMVATLLSAASPTISGKIFANTGSYAVANYLWAIVGGVGVIVGIVAVILFKKQTATMSAK